MTTFRDLLELLRKQQGSEEAYERALDMPLTVKASDGHMNCDVVDLHNAYPRFFAPQDEFAGSITLHGSLRNTRLVKEKNK